MAKNVKANYEALGFIEEEDGSLRVDDIVIPPPPVATLSHDVPEKRVIITELKICNFKSYANEVVLGPFDKNFTAVVGPNGSGKSNVIDSLLFVFGYRAKKIRSKKVSHLIHKSDQYPNVNSCTVTVRFDEIKETGDSYEIIPKTTFILSRTAFKDDTSRYRMNGRECPYKEIAKALRKYHIDLEHSRFLILQGEIEAISLMHPKAQNENESGGMLEYVEDIIGSNRYIQPIQKFSEKLEKLNEEKKEKLNNLKLVEKEKDDLEEPKNKAIEYLRIENQMILSENSLLHCKKFITEQELEEILSVKKSCVDKLNELKAEISKFKESRKTQEDEMEKISSALDANIKNYEKFKDTYKSLERKDVEMHEEIKHLKTKASKIESTLSSTEKELSKQKKQLETHEKETAELSKMKEKLETDKSVDDKKLSEVMETMQKETNILQEKKDKLETVLLKMKKEVHNLQSEKELLQSELNILTRTDAKEKKTLENMISSHENAEKNAKEEETLLKKEEKKIVDLQTEYDSVLQNILQSQQKEKSLKDQLQNTCLKYDEARASLANYKNSSGIMKAFSKEKAQGRFKGVYGRLGDLGAIDEKYDVAISTAAPALDHILTDNIESAQEGIHFLKKNTLGWTTFVALDKQEHYMDLARRKWETPENVPRLIDLIRIKDEKLLPAFFYAMGQTLVANDLEQATRIGYSNDRHRVVTLKGDLIEISGTMSGGGGKVSRGRMGQTVVECTHTPEEVRLLQQEIESLQKNLTGVKTNVLDLQEKVSKITKELSGLKLSVKKRQSSYKAYLDSAEMLKTQIEEQKKKVKNSVIDEKKVADLKSRIMQKEKSYNGSAKEASAIEEKVAKLQDEILKVTKGSMGKVAKSVEQLNKKISEVSQSITKSIVHAKNCRKNIKKNEEKIKNLEKEIASLNENKIKLQAEREKCVTQGRECLAKQEEAQVAVEELKTKKAELKKALETYHDKEHQLKLAEINQKNELKEHEVIESEKRAAIRSYNTRIGKLKLSEVENDPTDIPTLSAEQIEKLSLKRLQSDIDLLKVQLEDMKPDLSAIDEFKKKEKLCLEKQKDLDNIVKEKNLQNMRYDELRKLRLTEFMNGFTQIAKKLKEIYQMLTLGGDAELEVVDKFDPFAKGIDFSVRPPRKSWKFMRNLSGGEKTLSSLALVFALHYYRPTPFYVMDEIDAALDVRNVAIVGFFLKERQKNTQFIIVSLRNIMNELADHLIGIYKTGNTSKNVSLMGAAKWKEEDEAAEKPQPKKRKSK